VDLGEVEVHYQPIIDLKTSRPTMLEALARWRRPDQSSVVADVFIPIAEETGAIIEIGREVLRQACHAVQVWRRTVPGHSDLGIAVNVSAHQVLSGRLVEHVAEALKGSGMPPSALTLEITESTALEDPDRAAAQFALLRRLGVRIAVDDFGSASLGMLMRLTLDILKIDSTLLDFDTTRRGPSSPRSLNSVEQWVSPSWSRASRPPIISYGPSRPRVTPRRATTSRARSPSRTCRASSTAGSTGGRSQARAVLGPIARTCARWRSSPTTDSAQPRS
jgi:EAL domain-containing protein (putative c-di-GMP-specific phosphodiesterase class I)